MCISLTCSKFALVYLSYEDVNLWTITHKLFVVLLVVIIYVMREQEIVQCCPVLDVIALKK